MKILILCTGNSCRSQMAEGIMRNINPVMEVFSAGTRPEKEVNKYVLLIKEVNGFRVFRCFAVDPGRHPIAR